MILESGDPVQPGRRTVTQAVDSGERGSDHRLLVPGNRGTGRHHHPGHRSADDPGGDQTPLGAPVEAEVPGAPDGDHPVGRRHLGEDRGEIGHGAKGAAGPDGRQTVAMTDPLVRRELSDDATILLRLDHGKVNALSSSVLDALADAVAGITADLDDRRIGAVVVTGGERVFAAGADISEFGGPETAAAITERFHRTLDALAALPRFVIAAVNGYALGGGCELALACDYRIAAPSAVFGQPEVLLGIIPGGGGTQRLARAVGPSRAKELCLTGRQVAAEEALRIGLVDEIAEDPIGRARELAASVAAGATRAQALAKAVIDAGLSTTLAAGLGLERAAFVEVFATDDARIGIDSFRQHGPGRAEFTGR